MARSAPAQAELEPPDSTPGIDCDDDDLDCIHDDVVSREACGCADCEGAIERWERDQGWDDDEPNLNAEPEEDGDPSRYLCGHPRRRERGDHCERCMSPEAVAVHRAAAHAERHELARVLAAGCEIDPDGIPF